MEWLVALIFKPLIVFAYKASMLTLEWLVRRFMPDGRWKRLLLTRL